MKFITERHKKLMRTSETALHDAVRASAEDTARIAKAVVSDRRTYLNWEARHAELLMPAANVRDDRRMLNELRSAQLQLVPRCALFNYLKEHQVVGEKRVRVMSLFHRTLDFNDSVLLEHRNFLLAESSQISTDYITGLMHDVSGRSLMELYERAYANYFALKCELMTTRSRSCADLIGPLLPEASERLERIRKRIEVNVPESGGFSFETVDALARSGRHKVLNYLNA